jgi:hypothetical protein
MFFYKTSPKGKVGGPNRLLILINYQLIINLLLNLLIINVFDKT